jgi:predicted DNA-binding transcriptional regulator AlpA
MDPLLRYKDLKRLNLINNRATLQNRIRHHGFPQGRLLGPNTRVWTQAEIEEYLANRPTAPRPQDLKHLEGKRTGRRKAVPAQRDAAA